MAKVRFVMEDGSVVAAETVDVPAHLEAKIFRKQKDCKERRLPAIRRPFMPEQHLRQCTA